MRPRRSRPAAGAPPSAGQDPRPAALKLLGRRDYTSAELRGKLLDHGYGESAIDGVLRTLSDERWLDDRRVATAHARTAAAVKGRGRHRIERELAARGLDPDVIRDTLTNVLPDDESAAIEAVLRRKRVSRPLDAAGRRRLFQHLLRRGFGVDGIAKALRAYGRDDED